jgi:tetratricopeptide (TPR) repeat protein
MMNFCVKHPEQFSNFECTVCHQALCALCKPISFRGKIMCVHCCDKEEQCFLEQEIRKEASLLKSPFFKNFLRVIAGIAIFAGVFYLFLFWPREIKISLEDRERLQYALTQAYEAGKGSASYARQMKNIMRLDLSFRHILSFLHQGEQAFDAKQYSKALENYKSVKKMLPDWDWIYILIAKCYDALGQIDSAKEELKQAIELNPNGLKAYCVLGKIFAEAEAHDDAILQYTKASFIDPKNTEVLLQLSDLYFKKNRPSKAREYREKAQRITANKKTVP